jgi:hypothetical protein
MTPKEKAKELYNKMYLADDIKKCTLIAVDEMLRINSTTMYPVLEDHSIYSHKEYWNKVKQELEKL